MIKDGQKLNLSLELKLSQKLLTSSWVLGNVDKQKTETYEGSLQPNCRFSGLRRVLAQYWYEGVKPILIVMYHYKSVEVKSAKSVNKQSGIVRTAENAVYTVVKTCS